MARKGLPYDHPTILAIRKKIQVLEDKRVPYDDPRIMAMTKKIRQLEGTEDSLHPVGDEFASPLPPENLSDATDIRPSPPPSALTDAEKEWLRYYEGRSRVGALKPRERKDYHALLAKEKTMAKDSKKRVGDEKISYGNFTIKSLPNGRWIILDWQGKQVNGKNSYQEAMKWVDQVESTTDELLPVGSDPEKAKAIAAHNAGLTKSQDDIEPVGDGATHKFQPMEKRPTHCKVCGHGSLNAAHGVSPEERLKALGKTKDTELPLPIKTSNLVPLPVGENNEESYAPIPVGDSTRRGGGSDQSVSRTYRVGGGSDPGRVISRAADSMWQPDSPNQEKLDQLHNEVTGKGYSHKYTSSGGGGSMQHVYRKGGNEVNRATAIIKERKMGNHELTYRPFTMKAKDAAIHQQRSGSAPADHLFRAAQYEIQGDRARALDSYRAAAAGFRRLSDKPNEAKAQDGVAACQTRFAQEYVHPSAGRTRVCDSEDQAVESAVQRTRAGEAVEVRGKVVRPMAKARAADGSPKREELYQRMHALKKNGVDVSKVEKMFKRSDSTDAIIVVLGRLENEAKSAAKDTAGVSARWFKSEALAATYAKGLKATEGIVAAVSPDEGGWQVSWKADLGFALDVMPIKSVDVNADIVAMKRYIAEKEAELAKTKDPEVRQQLKRQISNQKINLKYNEAYAAEQRGKDAATLEPVPVGDAVRAVNGPFEGGPLTPTSHDDYYYAKNRGEYHLYDRSGKYLESANSLAQLLKAAKSKASDDTGGPPPVDEPKDAATLEPVPTGDGKTCPKCQGYGNIKGKEYEAGGRVDRCKVCNGTGQAKDSAFKKLEGKLAHEKGVTDPTALAASIGRKKYGTSGMAKKSAAGRAKDVRALLPVGGAYA